jgi:hypothetical protein
MNALTSGFRVFSLLVVMVLFVIVALISGCANGVLMTDEEKVACRDSGCAAFTLAELRVLIGKSFKQGYLRGWAESNKQGGRAL